jgi:hypothetical protein
MKLGIVTATTNRQRSQPYIDSWMHHATLRDRPVVPEVVENGPEHDGYLGTVPAFRKGVDRLLADTDVDVIACLHDDVRIFEDGWDEKVLRHFARVPRCGLLGFGGAIGLGSDRLYQDPYDPMQLARIGFRSNLIDAGVHGVRSLLPERVACLDGFSQIGRRQFWEGWPTHPRPWTVLEDLGVLHHFYDGMLGCLARRYGWETWYLPVACAHAGGQTAVGDQGYQAWAATQAEGGDHGLWKKAHQIGYEAFRDVLPLRV